MTRAGLLALALASAVVPAVAAVSGAPIVVDQIRRAFTVREVAIHRGETVRFHNADEFTHHIYVESSSFNFKSGEQDPGTNVDVAFPVAGRFDVRCEIHPRMRLSVTVE